MLRLNPPPGVKSPQHQFDAFYLAPAMMTVTAHDNTLNTVHLTIPWITFYKISNKFAK
jgi:hypothetical protein